MLVCDHGGTYQPAVKGKTGPFQRPLQRVQEAVLCTAWHRCICTLLHICKKIQHKISKCLHRLFISYKHVQTWTKVLGHFRATQMNVKFDLEFSHSLLWYLPIAWVLIFLHDQYTPQCYASVGPFVTSHVACQKSSLAAERMGITIVL